MSELAVPPKARLQVDEDLLKGIKWSSIVHLSCLVLFLIQSLVFPSKVKPYVPTLKVDLVGLPDVLKKDLTRPSQKQINQEISRVIKQAEETAKQVKATKKVKEIAQKDEMVVHPQPSAHKTVEKKNKRALERLKALAKIQDDGVAANPTKKTTLIKGNKISPGASLSGDAKEAAEANYLEVLRDRLQENWTLPPWVARQRLAAQVQIYIDAKGNLKGMKVLKQSGNTQFDEAVKRAVQESQPFPLPPKDLVSNLLADGILVGFPL